MSTNYILLHSKAKSNKQIHPLLILVEIKDEASFSNTSNNCLRDQDYKYINKSQNMKKVD